MFGCARVFCLAWLAARCTPLGWAAAGPRQRVCARRRCVSMMAPPPQRLFEKAARRCGALDDAFRGAVLGGGSAALGEPGPSREQRAASLARFVGLATDGFHSNANCAADYRAQLMSALQLDDDRKWLDGIPGLTKQQQALRYKWLNIIYYAIASTRRRDDVRGFWRFDDDEDHHELDRIRARRDVADCVEHHGNIGMMYSDEAVFEVLDTLHFGDHEDGSLVRSALVRAFAPTLNEVAVLVLLAQNGVAGLEWQEREPGAT
ncbi:hypothetical protein M885DRAFT_591305 [Pelagophyceae sp. CCMP2097]|nr:hypothetical protein M885DRAFT_591305 [Pelagophyceae sp. CCMP2097]